MYNSKNLPSTKIAQILFERAQKVIPGGTSLFGKRPSLYLPGKWPTYYRKAKGPAWDIDGNSYFDFTMVELAFRYQLRRSACEKKVANPSIM